MLDQVIRNARLPQGGEPVDIGFSAGRIAAIGRDLVCDAPSHDAGGCLCCAGLVETHIHLDKSRIIDRCRPEPDRLGRGRQADGRPADAMARISEVKSTFTVEDVHARARRTLEGCLTHGTTRMRTHVEVDPKVGLRGFEGVQALVAEYAWAVDLELCVMPQEGLTNNPGTEALMVECLRRGAKAVGAAPGYDSDPAAQIGRVFELAREFDVDIDMHLDLGETAEHLDLPLVCELTERFGWGGRVAVGHATKLTRLSRERQAEIARRLGEVGVAVTVLPATDLFLMGRDQEIDIRRGVLDAHLFLHEGCNCSLATNNVLNPFTPFGDGSLVRMANLQANVLQVSRPEDLAACFAMLTDRPARLMNLADYGIAVGNPADLVIFDATSPSQAVAELRAPLAAWKRGRRTLTRPRAELHAPGRADERPLTASSRDP